MRIGRQARRGLQFASEIFQLVFSDAAEQKRTCIDARRGVALKKHLVGRLSSFLAVEEMVEGDFIERCGRGIGRNVSADAWTLLIRPHDHRHGIPTDDAFDAAFDRAIAGIRGLFGNGDCVHIGRGGHAGVVNAAQHCVVLQSFEQIFSPLLAAVGDNVVPSIKPLGGFLGIVVDDPSRQSAEKRTVGGGDFFVLYAHATGLFLE